MSAGHQAVPAARKTAATPGSSDKARGGDEFEVRGRETELGPEAGEKLVCLAVDVEEVMQFLLFLMRFFQKSPRWQNDMF